MSDENSEDDAPDALLQLQGFFSVADPNGAANIELVQEFLELAAAAHFAPGMYADGRAAAVIENGFTSRHAIAGLSETDLRAMNFLAGHARELAKYLGGSTDIPRGGALPQNAAVDAITAATQVAQQSAAMVAAAVLDGQRPIELNGGNSGRPTVSSTVKFIENHAKKQATAGYCLAPLFKKIINDPTTDIDHDVLVDPALASDTGYFRVVVTSLSMDQMEDFGKGEDKSAVKLLQNVLCSVAECDTTEYLHAFDEFEKFEGTEVLNGIKNRFDQFQNKLTEVRYHSLFKLQDGINKLAMVVKPMPHLVHGMFGTWNSSPQGQATFSKILKVISVDLKKFKPKAPAVARKKEDKPRGDKARDSWRSPQGKRGGGGGNGRNPASGQSQTNNTSDRSQLWSPNGTCRFFYNTGSCRFDDCKFEHVAKDSRSSSKREENRASVNHITELAQVRRQLRSREAHIAEQDNHIERLNDATNMLTAELENEFRDRYSNGEDCGADSRLSEGSTECTVHCNPIFEQQNTNNAAVAPYPTVVHQNPIFDRRAAVMQVQTRSRARVRAPSEMERLRRDAKDAKVRSTCGLTDGPVIDSATDSDIIGGKDAGHATNVSEHEPFMFQTICGEGETKLRGDLETPLVTLLSAPIVASSPNSIVSHETLHDNGFDIVSSKKGTTLHRSGVSFETVKSGKMFRLPVVGKERIDDEVNYSVALHHKASLARVLKKLQLHRKRMHRPSDPVDCDVCPMLLARRKAVRLSPTAERAGESRGYVAGLDYMTGLPPDNDGNTALLGLVVASRKDGKSVAWYQPVKSHSGPDAIAAFTECEHRISLMFALGEFKLSRVHSDCEPSLIGSLVKHLKSRDLWMTRTEGYDHNGAGVVEDRNRTLLKGVRSGLLTATGGRCRYTEVWGSAFMASNDVINHTAYAGEKSPVQNAGGISFDVESTDSHIYGARVVRYQAKERRDEKLDVSGRLSNTG